MIELLAIRVADLEFALELSTVKEVIRPPASVRVPNLPGFVAAVINFRNVAIPVIDLGARFQAKSSFPQALNDGTGEHPGRTTNRLVICAVGPKVVAFAVDGASEIIRVPAEKVLPAGDVGLKTVVAGVVPWRDRLLVWLDAQGLLSSEEKLGLDSFRMRTEDLGNG